MVSAIAEGNAGSPGSQASPRSTAALAELIRDAGTSRLTVTVVGANTKAHWGGTLAPADLVLQTGRLHGVIRHDPGDLIATVRAGTSLRDVQAVLALAGQRLALSAGSPEATVGGVLATGEAGPLRFRYGTGRDLLLGVECVRADGVVARSGGRVVKNVAGYDVGRLLCGSYGTLAVITEATLRLHPLPQGSAWVSRPVASSSETARLVLALVRSRLALSAVEVDLVGAAGTVCALVEGSPTGAAERSAAAAALMGGDCVIEDQAPPWWGSHPFTPADVALKVAVPLSRLAGAIDAVLDSGGPGTRVRGSAGSGVLHAVLPAATPAELEKRVGMVRSALAAEPGRGGSCVVLAAAPELRGGLDLWGPVAGLALMRRVKQQFDPHGRLASGRFVGGI